MDLRPSTVTTTDDGWTWLSAGRRGAQLRRGFWSVVLSLALIGLAAAATLPPRPIAVPLVAVVLAGGLWTFRSLWHRAHSAVAVSGLGIAVRNGFDVAQISWPAVDAVLGEARGRRMRIVVATRGGGRHGTAATFSRAAALAWLEQCTDHARRRSLRPAQVDGCAGFRAG
jgi:hypothetical protein